MKFLKISSVFLLGLCAGLSQAQDTPRAWTFYGALGLNGVGIGVATPLNDRWSLRGDTSFFKRSATSTNDGVDYEATAELGTLGLFADYRPFDGVFRGTLGLLVNTPSVNLLAKPQSSTSLIINGKPYTLTSSADQLQGKIEFPRPMPYVGMGWGLGNLQKPGFKLLLDFGFAFGKPTASLTGTGILATQAQTDIAAQQAKLNDDLSKLQVLPVLKLGVGYTF